MSAHDPFLLIEQRPKSDGRLIASIAIVGLLSIALTCWLIAGIGGLSLFLAFAIGAGASGTAVLMTRPRARGSAPARVDWSMLRATLEGGISGVVITNRAGQIVCANPRYEELFAGAPVPRALAFTGDGASRLANGARGAWRDGEALIEELVHEGRRFYAKLLRVGQSEEYLVWRFRPAHEVSPIEVAVGLSSGRAGDRLGRAGVMIVVADPEGRLHAGNAAFVTRALGDAQADVSGRQLTDLLGLDGDGMLRLTREAELESEARPLRAIPVPLNLEHEDPSRR